MRCKHYTPKIKIIKPTIWKKKPNLAQQTEIPVCGKWPKNAEHTCLECAKHTVSQSDKTRGPLHTCQAVYILDLEPFQAVS